MSVLLIPTDKPHAKTRCLCKQGYYTRKANGTNAPVVVCSFSLVFKMHNMAFSINSFLIRILRQKFTNFKNILRVKTEVGILIFVLKIWKHNTIQL